MSSLYTRLKITLGRADADAEALAALQSDGKVTVIEAKEIHFCPTGSKPLTGVILYPGGRCDARAYAPVARAIAADGYQVFVANMPLRLAVLDANRIGKIMPQHPEIKRWVVGGHSMGGAMAAAWAFKHPETIAGLFFLASYAANMHAMPASDLPTAMIYGTHDFITRKSEFEASRTRLPGHTLFIAIEGGDHYQFGSFANMEVTATIPRAEQQRQTIKALEDFLGMRKSSDNNPQD
jgi:pimeloyl-ACP methyl ester carboxylesterase